MSGGEVAIENMENERTPENQVITYEAPWIIYALGFSCKSNYPYRLGIGSFVEDIRNEIEIIQLNLDTQLFERKACFDHTFPATKLIWLPEKDGSKPDLLATSGENLKIWQVLDNKEVQIKSNLVN